MIVECLRVARRGICLTTPNRWFPIEFHTALPLIHWLPKPAGRALFKKLGYEFFAEETNLNLMTRSEIEKLSLLSMADGALIYTRQAFSVGKAI